jgi:hypothetical protein
MAIIVPESVSSTVASKPQRTLIIICLVGTSICTSLNCLSLTCLDGCEHVLGVATAESSVAAIAPDKHLTSFTDCNAMFVSAVYVDDIDAEE